MREESHLDDMRSAIRGDFERLAERRGGQDLMRAEPSEADEPEPDEVPEGAAEAGDQLEPVRQEADEPQPDAEPEAEAPADEPQIAPDPEPQVEPVFEPDIGPQIDPEPEVEPEPEPSRRSFLDRLLGR